MDFFKQTVLLMLFGALLVLIVLGVLVALEIGHSDPRENCMWQGTVVTCANGI